MRTVVHGAASSHPLAGSSVPPWASEAEVAAAAETLMAAIDPKRYVGTKHHIVPQFILRRFANNRDQVQVRRRDRAGPLISNIKDLAVTDFYTFVDMAGELDSSFEHLWGVIEGAAAAVLHEHLDNPFSRPRPFTLDEKQAIDALVSLQSTRGPAARRIGELVADYEVKLLNQHMMSADELLQWEFSPHQNDHIMAMSGLAERIDQELASRHAFLISLDRPLLIISDEPVCLERPDNYAPPTRAQMRDHPRGVLVDGEQVPADQLIQFHNPRGAGFRTTEAIAMPISPRHAIVYGPPGSAGPRPHLQLARKDADHFAREVTQICLEQAIVWVAGHPGHATLASLRLPPAQPPIVIIDGGSPFAHDARKSTRRMPRRLNKHARLEPTSPPR